MSTLLPAPAVALHPPPPQPPPASVPRRSYTASRDSRQYNKYSLCEAHNLWACLRKCVDSTQWSFLRLRFVVLLFLHCIILWDYSLFCPQKEKITWISYDVVQHDGIWNTDTVISSYQACVLRIRNCEACTDWLWEDPGSRATSSNATVPPLVQQVLYIKTTALKADHVACS